MRKFIHTIVLKISNFKLSKGNVFKVSIISVLNSWGFSIIHLLTTIVSYIHKKILPCRYPKRKQPPTTTSAADAAGWLVDREPWLHYADRASRRWPPS